MKVALVGVVLSTVDKDGTMDGVDVVGASAVVDVIGAAAAAAVVVVAAAAAAACSNHLFLWCAERSRKLMGTTLVFDPSDFVTLSKSTARKKQQIRDHYRW